MPCYRCGTRQVDPDRGQSPWKRGVRAAHQVLICPGCQEAFDWAADLDRCPVCGGCTSSGGSARLSARTAGMSGSPRTAALALALARRLCAAAAGR
jgi:ribosomal protein S27E